MRRAGVVLLGLLGIGVLAAKAAVAHEAFPARLDLVEVEPGLFDVAFSLPIIEGRKLRAEPVLPPACEEVTSREAGLTASGVTTTWRVLCTPPSLAGEVVLIDGLLGTQTDLAVRISTLDGRVHSAILKPSRPGLLVPPPPSLGRLAQDAVLEGMRRVLERIELWLLLLVVAVAIGVRRRSAAAGVVAFATAHLAGQWLGAKTWLQVSSHLPPSFALLTALPPALALASRLQAEDGEGGSESRNWVRPWWVVSMLLGLLYGGARPEALPAEGLSRAEQSLASLLFTAGIALGMFVLVLVARETYALLESIGGERLASSRRRLLGYLAGTATVGLLLHRAFALPVFFGALSRSALALVLLAAVLGPALRAGGAHPQRAWSFVAFTVGLGLLPGLSGLALPFGPLVVTGSLFFLAVCVATGRLPSRPWLFGATVVACLAHGWQLGYTLGENVSRPVGTAVGTVLAAVCVLYASLALTPPASAARSMTFAKPVAGVRFVAGAVAVLAILWQLGAVRVWFDERVATEAALGLVRLPLLSLALLVTAALAWPRRRRVLTELGIEERPRIGHWALLGLAFFLVPVGTAAVRNPFFEARAPEGDAARRLVARVLSDTYHAFNIEDEGELFDRLSESVTGDLVADLYLDSRRRLTAGTREGAEVTVRDVSVLEIGDAVGRAISEHSFAYDCRWVVTARVRHLQHIHHRQNIYNGVLTIQIEGERWKIAGVDLRTEDRVVLPWQPT